MDSGEKQVYVDSGSGVSLATYVRGGAGPWVVFINGHTRPASDFRAFMRFVSEHGYSSLSLDNRGAGATVAAQPFTRADMVGDVLSAMDQHSIERAHILGISMGGVLAQQLGAEHGVRVRSLALVSTTCRSKYLVKDDSPWTDDFGEIMEKMRPYFSESFFKSNKLLIESMCKQILKNMSDDSFAESAKKQKEAMKSYDTTGCITRITCPTIAFHGTEDRIILPQVVDEFRQLMPSIQTKLYEGVGHLILAESPKRLYADYLDFLGNVSD